METFNINPTPCPYCGSTIKALDKGDKPVKENDLTVCMSCGELLFIGPYMTFKKCDLTSDQLSDKLGLLLYGTLLQVQSEIKTKAAAIKLLKQLKL